MVMMVSIIAAMCGFIEPNTWNEKFKFKYLYMCMTNILVIFIFILIEVSRS
jgi:hypothetical protein